MNNQRMIEINFHHFSVIEQVHNSKLTTYSLNQLNDLFAQTESEVQIKYFYFHDLCLALQ